MRHNPTLTLSKRLMAFITMMVISAMFVLLIGVVFSFKQLAQNYSNHILKDIVKAVDNQITFEHQIAFGQQIIDHDHTDGHQIESSDLKALQAWLPNLLSSSNILEMKLYRGQDTLYQFDSSELLMSLAGEPVFLHQQSFQLPNHPRYTVYFQILPPYYGIEDSPAALVSIPIAICLVIVFLLRARRWVDEQFLGSELLENRARLILAGKEDKAKGNPKEWPLVASLAFDNLIEELQDLRQDRSRFDTFIRSQRFLDKLTGSANHILFDLKLDSTLLQKEAFGALFFIHIDLVDSFDPPKKQGVASGPTFDEFLIDIAQVLQNSSRRYAEVTLARYYKDVFTLIVPNLDKESTKTAAAYLLKQLERLSSRSKTFCNWCHMGVTLYQQGEIREALFNELDVSMRSAKAQGTNAWSLCHKHIDQNQLRSKVEWRVALTNYLKKDDLIIYQQPVYLLGERKQLSLDHLRLSASYQDPQLGLIEQSRLLTVIDGTGYQALVDRHYVTILFKKLKKMDEVKKVSIALNVKSFANHEHYKWLRFELLQLTASLRHALIFEFVEIDVVTHRELMHSVAKMLHGLGCALCISHAGQSIVSSYYLKEMAIDYLLLASGLVRRINSRSENQLFISSLIGASQGLPVKIMACDIEERSEEKTLFALGIHYFSGFYYQDKTPLLFAGALHEPNLLTGGRMDLSASTQLMMRPKYSTLKASTKVHTPVKVRSLTRNRWKKS